MKDVVRTGTVIAGRYRVERLAWPAPAGPVWEARDTVLNRPVLVHMLGPDVAGDAGTREALLRIAARDAQLVDRRLVQIYDCGDDPPYLVTEHPTGGRLAERLRDGTLPVAEAARVASSVGAALRVLHQAGRTHGAIGPAWVAFDEEGRAKLLGPGLVEVAMLAGGARGEPADPPVQPEGYPGPDPKEPAEADLRALAALTVHMLTGRPPNTPGTSLTGSRGVTAELASAVERALGGHSDLPSFLDAVEPFAAPKAPPAAREPGYLRTEGRWLLALLLFLGVAAGAIVAGLTVAKLLPQRREGAASPSPSPRGALSVAAVRDFDPNPGNGSEHPEKVALVLDGDATSAWTTVGYASANLGGSKPGVGLLFDLGANVRVDTIRLRSPIAGWRGEWRVSGAAGGSAADYRVVASFTASSDGAVKPSGENQGRYWLLWITELANAGSGSNLPFQAAVAEITFEAAG